MQARFGMCPLWRTRDNIHVNSKWCCSLGIIQNRPFDFKCLSYSTGLWWWSRNSVYLLIYVYILIYGPEMWVVTERIRLHIQVMEMRFPCRIAGLTDYDRVRSMENWEIFWIEEPTEVGRANYKGACYLASTTTVSGTFYLTETQGQTQYLLGILYFTVGLRTSKDSPGRAGICILVHDCFTFKKGSVDAKGLKTWKPRVFSQPESAREAEGFLSNQAGAFHLFN